MIQLRSSLLKRPINLYLLLIALAAYCFNRFCLKPYLCRLEESSVIRYFFVCYFNDLICPLLFFSYANILLVSINRELKKLSLILLIGFGTSIIWEFVAPLFKPTATTDLVDILCYMIGAVVYWAVLRRSVNGQRTETECKPGRGGRPRSSAAEPQPPSP